MMFAILGSSARRELLLTIMVSVNGEGSAVRLSPLGAGRVRGVGKC